MSPIETMPTSRLCSTTGRWRNLPSVIRSITELMVSDLIAGHDLARHDFAQRHIQRRRAARPPPDDVALRQDADDAMIGAGDHQRADLSFGQTLGGGRYGWLRLDGDDVAALGSKDGFYGHGSLPPWSLPRPHAAPAHYRLAARRDVNSG